MEIPKFILVPSSTSTSTSTRSNAPVVLRESTESTSEEESLVVNFPKDDATMKRKQQQEKALPVVPVPLTLLGLSPSLLCSSSHSSQTQESPPRKPVRQASLKALLRNSLATTLELLEEDEEAEHFDRYDENSFAFSSSSSSSTTTTNNSSKDEEETLTNDSKKSYSSVSGNDSANDSGTANTEIQPMTTATTSSSISITATTSITASATAAPILPKRRKSNDNIY